MSGTRSYTDVAFHNRNTAYGDVLVLEKDVTTRWPEDITPRFPIYVIAPKSEEIKYQVQTPETQQMLSYKTGRGRPPKYPWDKFFQQIVLIANNPDGLPDTQAELERTMANWCSEKWGHEPTESMIRSKISPIYQSIKNKANKSV